MEIQLFNEYFTDIMTKATRDVPLDDEDISSLSRIGRTIGSLFYERDDVSILISLKNANTASQFLDSLEKTAMRAAKDSSSSGESDDSWISNQDLEAAITLLTDDETFKPAKQIIVIHAALSAQYAQVTNSN
jgi:hypothetical protein